MQPDEIDHFNNVTIDHSNYYGRTRLKMPPRIRRFSRYATSLKQLLLAVAIVAALVFTASLSIHRADGSPTKVGALISS